MQSKYTHIFEPLTIKHMTLNCYDTNGNELWRTEWRNEFSSYQLL